MIASVTVYRNVLRTPMLPTHKIYNFGQVIIAIITSDYNTSLYDIVEFKIGSGS